MLSKIKNFFSSNSHPKNRRNEESTRSNRFQGKSFSKNTKSLNDVLSQQSEKERTLTPSPSKVFKPYYLKEKKLLKDYLEKVHEKQKFIPGKYNFDTHETFFNNENQERTNEVIDAFRRNMHFSPVKKLLKDLHKESTQKNTSIFIKGDFDRVGEGPFFSTNNFNLDAFLPEIEEMRKRMERNNFTKDQIRDEVDNYFKNIIKQYPAALTMLSNDEIKKMRYFKEMNKNPYVLTGEHYNPDSVVFHEMQHYLNFLQGRRDELSQKDKRGDNNLNESSSINLENYFNEKIGKPKRYTHAGIDDSSAVGQLSQERKNALMRYGIMAGKSPFSKKFGEQNILNTLDKEIWKNRTEKEYNLNDLMNRIYEEKRKKNPVAEGWYDQINSHAYDNVNDYKNALEDEKYKNTNNNFPLRNDLLSALARSEQRLYNDQQNDRGYNLRNLSNMFNDNPYHTTSLARSEQRLYNDQQNDRGYNLRNLSNMFENHPSTQNNNIPININAS